MSYPYPADSPEPGRTEPGQATPADDATPGPSSSQLRAAEGSAAPASSTESHHPLRRGRTARAAVLVALVVAVAGGLLGWLWAEVAPRLAVIKADQGFLYAESEPEQPIAADGWFAIIGAGAGILIAVLVWVALRRYRGIAMLLAVTLGSLGSALIAFWVGYKIGYAQFLPVRDAAHVGDTISAPLELATTNLDPHNVWKLFPSGVAAAQALFAAFTYTFLAGFASDPDLRGDTVEDDQLGPGFTGNSDSAIGTART